MVDKTPIYLDIHHGKEEDQWGALKHHNIAAVMTDSPSMENLEFLSDVTVTTADPLLISPLASSSLTSYMHLPEYLAKIVFPTILIDVTWPSDVGQDLLGLAVNVFLTIMVYLRK
jgi:hypothetical protein